MKRLTTALAAMAIAFLGNVAFGQEASGVPEKIIKELDGLVGKWTVEGKIGDKVQTGGFTCRWARTEDKKKCCLIGRFSYKTGDNTRSGATLVGWNAAKECIEDRGFDANGGNARLLWKVKSPTVWQGEAVMIENGKEVKSKVVLVRKGPSEAVMESESETGEAAGSSSARSRRNPRRKPRSDGRASRTRFRCTRVLSYSDVAE